MVLIYITIIQIDIMKRDYFHKTRDDYRVMMCAPDPPDPPPDGDKKSDEEAEKEESDKSSKEENE